MSKVVWLDRRYSAPGVFVEAEDGQDKPPMDMFQAGRSVGRDANQGYQLQYKLENFAIVRPCNVYGPGDNFDPNAIVIPC